MIKKSISLFIIVTIIAFVALSASASDNVDNNENILEKLETLEIKYGVEFEELKDSIDKDKLISVSSIEELENGLIDFIKLIEEEKENVYKEEIIKVSENTRSYNGSYTWTWYAPFSGWGFMGIACWKNISHEHTYDWDNGEPYWTSCSNIISYVTGIQIAAGWVQTSSYYNITTDVNYNETLSNTVSGYWFLVIDINGFTIGARINSTWATKSLRIVS